MNGTALRVQWSGTCLPRSTSRSRHVRVQRNGALVTISLTGTLDANTGVELLASLQAELDAGADRVDIDLLAVDGLEPRGRPGACGAAVGSPGGGGLE